MTINLKVLKLNTFYIKLFTNNVGPTAIGYPNVSSDLKKIHVTIQPYSSSLLNKKH